MKLLTLILSLYFITLSAVPCVDGEDAVKDTKREISHTDNDKEQHSDSCSPFCVCACCGVTLSNYAPANFFEAKSNSFKIIKAESHYQSAFISSYHQSIWQPPQLA